MHPQMHLRHQERWARVAICKKLSSLVTLDQTNAMLLVFKTTPIKVVAHYTMLKDTDSALQILRTAQLQQKTLNSSQIKHQLINRLMNVKNHKKLA